MLDLGWKKWDLIQYGVRGIDQGWWFHWGAGKSMQKLNDPSFFFTSTTRLAHGWLDDSIIQRSGQLFGDFTPGRTLLAGCLRGPRISSVNRELSQVSLPSLPVLQHERMMMLLQHVSQFRSLVRLKILHCHRGFDLLLLPPLDSLCWLWIITVQYPNLLGRFLWLLLLRWVSQQNGGAHEFFQLLRGTG